MEAIFKEFIKESPDYNLMLSEGHIEKIAANRVILSIMTEFSLMNNRNMKTGELLSLIESLQIIRIITGTIKTDKLILDKPILNIDIFNIPTNISTNILAS